MNIRTVIAEELTSVGLPFDAKGLRTIEQGIKDELDAASLGKLIGDVTGKPGFRYRRVAQLIYSKLEKGN